jgi:hypothetical protein
VAANVIGLLSASCALTVGAGNRNAAKNKKTNANDQLLFFMICLFELEIEFGRIKLKALFAL